MDIGNDCTLLCSTFLSRTVSGIVARMQVGHQKVITAIKPLLFTLEPTGLHGNLNDNLLLPCQVLKQNLLHLFGEPSCLKLEWSTE